MANKGRLTKDKFNTNMPVDAPLDSKPPIYYTDVEEIALTYETDENAVLDILPEGLEISEPAFGIVLFRRYPFSTLGPYEEVILIVGCSFEGKPCSYIPHIVVNSDIPMAAGREIWGYPKKFAHITLEKDGDLIIGTMERPKGNRICTGVVRPEKRLPISDTGKSPGLSFRVIPSPDGSSTPSLAELIETPTETSNVDAYTGSGSLEFNSTSSIDPWHRLVVKKMLNAGYRRFDMVLHPGKVVKRYTY